MKDGDRHPDGARALSTLSQLTQGQTLWAALDGAHDERINLWVRAGNQPWACLYAGQIADELVEVAPYLVRLKSPHAGSQRLLEHGWSRSWGVYLTCAAPLAELRRHLRRYLRVATEDGQRMLFRFHDPRVLRLYLPTCTPRELEDFFGPIDALYLELPDASGFESCRREGGKLSVERVRLLPAVDAPSLHRALP